MPSLNSQLHMKHSYQTLVETKQRLMIVNLDLVIEHTSPVDKLVGTVQVRIYI